MFSIAALIYVFIKFWKSPQKLWIATQKQRIFFCVKLYLLDIWNKEPYWIVYWDTWLVMSSNKIPMNLNVRKN